MKKYTVQKGDNLTKIAKNMGLSVSELTTANPTINPNKIQIGQQLNYKDSARSTDDGLIFRNVAEKEPGPGFVDNVKSSISNVKSSVGKAFSSVGDAIGVATGMKYDQLETPKTNFPITKKDKNSLDIDCGPGISDAKGCLSQLRKAMSGAGRNYGIPAQIAYDYPTKYNVSKASKPTKEDVQKYPHYRGDKEVGSVDSWDMPEVLGSDKENWDVKYNLSDSIAKYPNYLTDPKFKDSRIMLKEENANEKLRRLNGGTSLPFGTYMGMGRIADTPKYTNDPQYFKNKPVHSTGVIGFTPEGDHVISSNGMPSRIGKNNYETRQLVNFVAVPKSSKNMTFENIDKLMKESEGENVYGKHFKGKRDATAFSNAIHAQKSNITKQLGISPEDYDDYHKIALGLSAAETNLGEDPKAIALLDVIGSSNGMTQLNPENLKGLNPKQKQVLKSYGIDADNVTAWQMQDPRVAALTTMVFLSQLDGTTKRWSNENPNGKDMYWEGQDEKTERGPIEAMFRNHKREFVKNRNGSYTFYHRDKGYKFPKVNEGETTESYLNRIKDSKEYKAINGEDGEGFTLEINEGSPRVKYTSKGNNPNLTRAQRIAYGWNNPAMLRSGDATTPEKNGYVKKVQDLYEQLTALGASK